MGFAEGFGAGMQMRAAFRLSQANADQQELQTKMLQQQFDAGNKLRDQMFLPPDYRMVNHPAVETAPSNLEDIIGQAEMGRAPSNYDPSASVAPQVRGAYQQQQPTPAMSGDFHFGESERAIAAITPPSMRGGARHEPAPFGAYQPHPEVNRIEHPPVELDGPGEKIDNVNGRAIPRDSERWNLASEPPGVLAEGPRPTSGPQMSEAPGAAYRPAQITPGRIADEAIPGTGGPLSHLSPQMQEIGKTIMQHNGGDYEKTAYMMNLLTNGQANLPMASTPHVIPAFGSLTSTDKLGRQVGTPIQGNQRQNFQMLTDSQGRSWMHDTYSDRTIPNDPSIEPGETFHPYQSGAANAGGKAGQDMADLYAHEFPDEARRLESVYGRGFDFDMYRKHATVEQKAHMRDVVNAQAVSQAEKIAKAQAGVNIDKQLDSPMSPTDASRVGMPVGTTMRDAKKMELMAPDMGQKKDYYNFSAAGNILDDIFRYAKQVPDVKPGLIGKLGGAKNYAAQVLQTNHAAKMLDIKKGEVAMLVRALGEAGALATLDVERVKALLPNVWDTMAIRISKMEDLLGLFEKNYQSYVKTHTGMTKDDMLKGGPGANSKNVPRRGKTTPARTTEEQAIYDKARAKSAQNMRQQEVAP